MNDPKVPKDYEKVDANEECRRQYKEKEDRFNRIDGGDDGYGEVPEGGFIHRNNVYDRI